MEDGGVHLLLSMILPDIARRARVLDFLANPDSNEKHQIWYGTGDNGKTLLATKLVARVAPELKIVHDVRTVKDAINSVPSESRAIIITNILDNYTTDDDVVVHFDQRLEGLQFIDLDAKSVDKEFMKIIDLYKSKITISS